MMQFPNVDTRAGQLVPMLTTALAVAAAFNAIDAMPVGVFYDDALYTILAKSLATGHGYRYLNVPGAPNATHYPPGFPLLLAALWRLSPEFPGNVALFKAVNAVLVGVVAWLSYAFGRRRLGMPPWTAAGVALAGTATIPLLVLSSAVMSEVFFLALLLPWLLFAESRIGDDARDGASATLGATAGLLFYVRAHAIVLLPALVAAFLLRRRWRPAFIALATGALVVAPWFAWVAVNDPGIPEQLRGSYGSYAGWLSAGVERTGLTLFVHALRDNLLTTAAIITRSFALSRRPAFAWIALPSVVALFVAGCVVLYRRARLTVLFVLLYLAVVMIWPFSPLRFIWGLWPLLMVLIAAGAMDLLRRPARRSWRAAIVAMVGLVVAGLFWFNVRGYANAWWTTVSRPIAPRIVSQLRWVARNATPRDVVAADDEGAVFLYTGVRAIPANVFTAAQYVARRSAAENADNLRAIVDTFRPTYVLAWAYPTLAAAERLAALTGSNDTRFVTVDTLSAGGRVYAPITAAMRTPRDGRQAP